MRKSLLKGKIVLQKAIFPILFLGLLAFNAPLTEVLIDFNFQSTSIPAAITHSGTLSTNGSIGNCTECTTGRLNIPLSGFFQVALPSLSEFKINLKSSASGTRNVTLKYKLETDADFNTLGVLSVVGTAGGVYTFTLTTLYPQLVSGNPITIRLENAPSGGEFHIHDLYVTGSSEPGTAAEITAFKIPGQIGNEMINSSNASIDINMPLGSMLNAVVPETITISPGSSISPAADHAQDFSENKEVVYIVTAQDEETTKAWTVKVTEIASAAKDILAFKLADAQLGNASINPAEASVVVNMPFGVNLNNIVPQLLTISDNASINPAAGTPRNFSQLVTYTVTAQDNSTKEWTIYVNVLDEDANVDLDFEVPVGFASVITGSGEYAFTSETFYGPVSGGQHAADTLWINGPEEFDILAKAMYNRRRVYNNASQSWGGTFTKGPLVIVIKEGVYPPGTTESSAWNAGQRMMRLQDQADLTIIGQGNVVLNWGFNLIDSWNILIRNITFQDYFDDGVNIDGGHHVWVDHCTFGHPITRPVNQDNPDGGVDIKSGADYITVSWCNFRNSWKTNLIGHSDNNAEEDLGKLKVTLYANYYTNSNSRNPRVRFGEVHVLNNLMEELSLYGIAASNLSQVYAENNFYLNTRWPMYADRNLTDFRAVYGNNSDGVFTSKTGNRDCTGLKAVGNAYDDSGLSIITNQINPIMLNPGGRSIKFDEKNPELVFNPAAYYTYEALPASVVKIIIPLYAGAQKVEFFQTAPQLPVASISINASLDSFIQEIGEASALQTYSVTASNLSSNLTITPPAGFEVSVNETEWFDVHSPLILSAESGNISVSVQLRLNAAEEGSYSGTILHTASGATAILLNVSGTVLVPGTPQIQVQESLTAFTQILGSPSALQSYSVSAINLSANLTITPPASFEVSVNENDWFNADNPLIISPESGNVNSVEVVIRLNATEAGDYSGDILHTSTGATIVALNISGEVNVPAVPQILVQGSLTAFNQSIGSASPLQSYIISGTDLNAAVSIIPPAGFELALSSTGSWRNLTDPLVLDVANGALTETTIFVRLNAQAAGSYHGDIVHSSESAQQITVSVQGEASIPFVAPRITVTAALEGFNQVVGSPSSTQTYLVKAVGLTEDLSIITPANFELSVDEGNTWRSNGETIGLSPVNGTIDDTPILVRMNVNRAGSFFGGVLHVSGQAQAVNLDLNGEATLVTSLFDTEKIMFQTFPNPVREVLTIYRGNAGSEAIVNVYSASGLKIQTLSWAATSKELNLIMTNLAPGVYFIEYNNRSEKEFKRVLKY